jgi:hypothetical protein
MARQHPTKTARHAAVAAAASLALSGCAVVQSNKDLGTTSPQGVVYMLPKALLPVQLLEADGMLMLRVLPAVTVGDPAQRYHLVHTTNVLASDDVKIEVDPATGLLKEISATAEDQTLAVLTELAKGSRIAQAELSAPAGETLLFSGLYDPDGGGGPLTPNGRLQEGLHRALLSRVTTLAAACASTASDPGCQTVTPLKAALEAALAAGIGPGNAVAIVKATALAGAVPETTPASGEASAAAADCSIGVCHRALRPFIVELSIRGVYAQSTVVLLPNGAAPVALALARAPFVKTEHTVKFSAGQLQSVQTKRPSSALMLVKWPLDVYEAVLNATSTLIQLRIGADKKQVESAQSQLDTAKELKRIGDELDKLKKQDGTAPEFSPALSVTRVGGPQRGDALLAIELGPRPTVSTPALPAQGAAAGPGTLPGTPK